MFSNLIESGSHAADFKRRGAFFAGALAFYGLLLAAAGVGSVYAFNAHLASPPDYEITILRFRPDDAPSEPARAEAPRPAAAAGDAPQPARRVEISVQTPYKGESIASASTPEVNPRARVIIANFNSNAVPGGLVPGERITGGSPGALGSGDGPRVVEAGTPPPLPPKPPQPAATPAPTPRQDRPLQLSTSVLTGKAVSKPVPPYPPIARQGRIQGAVAVQVLVNESGRVVSAKATSGHPLLQHAAVQAALQARFTPTLLNGQPLKVSGVITYNFTLQ
jgi:protein TonB